MHESHWTSASDKGGYGDPVQSSEDFARSHRDKPVKAIIGIAVLVVLALVFSRMNPASHDVSNAPSVTTGQTGAAR